MKNYFYRRKVDLDFNEALDKIKKELVEVGFGILTEINVKTTFKNKLNVDFQDYVILGPCNPENAFKAIQTELNIGLMLPCKVIVYSNNGEVYISAIRPTITMSVVNNKDLEEVASNIENKLKMAVDSV